MLLQVKGTSPTVGKGSYIAPTASLIGDVKMGQSCTVMFNAVLRGDVMPIEIGQECNIQDNVVIHGTYQSVGTVLGDRVSVGHGALIHGAEVGDGTLVGMGAILMDHCKIGKHCLVAAGSLVTERMEVPEGHLVVGRPAKVKRKLTDEEIKKLEKSADNYLLYKSWYEQEGEIR